MTALEGFSTDRRTLLRSSMLLGAGAAILPTVGFAQSDARAAIRAAATANKAADIKRIQDWIALPTIAAENLNVAEGAAYMEELAKAAGFTGVRQVPTDGIPGVVGFMDNGAPHTLGIYFIGSKAYIIVGCA